jgi:hypothetical protein
MWSAVSKSWSIFLRHPVWTTTGVTGIVGLLWNWISHIQSGVGLMTYFLGPDWLEKTTSSPWFSIIGLLVALFSFWRIGVLGVKEEKAAAEASRLSAEERDANLSADRAALLKDSSSMMATQIANLEAAFLDQADAASKKVDALEKLAANIGYDSQKKIEAILSALDAKSKEVDAIFQWVSETILIDQLRRTEAGTQDGVKRIDELIEGLPNLKWNEPINRTEDLFRNLRLGGVIPNAMVERVLGRLDFHEHRPERPSQQVSQSEFFVPDLHGTFLQQMAALKQELQRYHQAIDAALERSPKAFNRVHASAVRCRVDLGLMLNPNVVIAVVRKVFVAAKFIRVDGRSGQDMLIDKCVHGRLRAACDNAGNEFAAAFQHPNNAGLVTLVTAAHARDGAADQGFVNFDFIANAAQGVVAIQRAHILADFVAHAPSRFVGHAKLTLDFLSRHAVAGAAKQKHDVEPVAQGRAGPLKGRSSHRSNLIAAILARVNLAGFDAIEMGAPSATGAIVPVTKARAHKVFKASILSREAVHKLAEGGGFRLHASLLAECST